MHTSLVTLDVKLKTLHMILWHAGSPFTNKDSIGHNPMHTSRLTIILWSRGGRDQTR